ncbi:zinc-binding dehydrogenase [Streptomyces sp. NPDC093509]
MLRDGAIETRIDRVFPLREAAAALRHAESGTVVGKVVITPSGQDAA